MAYCPYCQQRVSWWQPLVTWRGETFWCPHCQRALRLDARRYAVLSGCSIALIVGVNRVQSAHPYLLIAFAAAVAVVLTLVFGKVVKAEPGDDNG